MTERIHRLLDGVELVIDGSEVGRNCLTLMTARQFCPILNNLKGVRALAVNLRNSDTRDDIKVWSSPERIRVHFQCLTWKKGEILSPRLNINHVWNWVAIPEL